LNKFTFGREGHLFLDGDTNQVQKQISGEVGLLWSERLKIFDAHRRAAKRAAKIGARYAHIIAPNKETALRRYLMDPSVYEKYGPTPVSQYFRSIVCAKKFSYFDRDALSKNSELPSYYLSDSHWTAAGAITYLRRALEHFEMFDIVERLRSLEFSVSEIECIGDLGMKAWHEAEMIKVVHLKNTKHINVFHSEIINEGYVQHTKSHGGVGKALILHDSFAHALIPVLQELFAETLFVHCPDSLLDLEDSYRPDVIIRIQAERFFMRQPLIHPFAPEWIAEIENQKGTTNRTSNYISKLIKERALATA
jgi:hypothetical protein